MRKTVITAAAAVISAALAGFAFAASPSGPTTPDDTSVVVPASPAGTTSGTHLPRVDDSDGRVGGGRGADDVNDAPDDSDGRVGGGHGADDPVGQDSGDDHGTDHDGADDPVGQDSGDDHGTDHDGADDHGSDHGSDHDGPDDHGSDD